MSYDITRSLNANVNERNTSMWFHISVQKEIASSVRQMFMTDVWLHVAILWGAKV